LHPAGDEADAIATAPTISKFDSIFPLVNPSTADSDSKKGKSPATGFDVLHNFGNLAPWRSVESSWLGLANASPIIPAGCKLEQVHLVQRHGARYPTTGAPPSQFATALHGLAGTTGVNVSGPLGFLVTWEYQLGAEILTPFGRSQL
jgi:hypothetical protein